MDTMHDTTLHAWKAAEADGIQLTYPPDWSLLRGALGSLLAVRAPDPSPDGFQANVTVVDRPGAGEDLDAILAVQLGELGCFTDALVLDAEITDLAGRPATRVLIAHRSDDFELTLDQWIVPAGRRILTVSATSATAHHAEACEALDAIVASFTIHG